WIAEANGFHGEIRECAQITRDLVAEKVRIDCFLFGLLFVPHDDANVLCVQSRGYRQQEGENDWKFCHDGMIFKAKRNASRTSGRELCDPTSIALVQRRTQFQFLNDFALARVQLVKPPVNLLL